MIRIDGEGHRRIPVGKHGLVTETAVARVVEGPFGNTVSVGVNVHGTGRGARNGWLDKEGSRCNRRVSSQLKTDRGVLS